MNAKRGSIVDGIEAFCERRGFVLAAAGFGVDTATPAAQALFKLPQGLPDAILMDSQMPTVDDIEQMRQLQADPAHRGRVIAAFMTGAAKVDVPNLRAAACNGPIAKPVDVMLLATEVRFGMAGPDRARGNHFVWPCARGLS